MSECVVRMEMPKGCGYCRIAQFGYCGITYEPVADAYMGYPENRPKTCPIIAVLPEGHGRLGDLDELAKIVNAVRIEAMQKGFDTNPYWLLGDIIAQAKTIVQAEAQRSET